MKDLAEADICEESNRVWQIINTIAGKKSAEATEVRKRDGKQINNTLIRMEALLLIYSVLE